MCRSNICRSTYAPFRRVSNMEDNMMATDNTHHNLIETKSDIERAMIEVYHSIVKIFINGISQSNERIPKHSVMKIPRILKV